MRVRGFRGLSGFREFRGVRGLESLGGLAGLGGSGGFEFAGRSQDDVEAIVDEINQRIADACSFHKIKIPGWQSFYLEVHGYYNPDDKSTYNLL